MFSYQVLLCVVSSSYVLDTLRVYIVVLRLSLLTKCHHCVSMCNSRIVFLTVFVSNPAPSQCSIFNRVIKLSSYQVLLCVVSSSYVLDTLRVYIVVLRLSLLTKCHHCVSMCNSRIVFLTVFVSNPAPSQCSIFNRNRLFIRSFVSS